MEGLGWKRSVGRQVVWVSGVYTKAGVFPNRSAKQGSRIFADASSPHVWPSMGKLDPVPELRGTRESSTNGMGKPLRRLYLP